MFKYLNKETCLMFINDFLEYGTIFPKNKLTLAKLKKDNFSAIKEPIFFLSTGRCGTALISEILKLDGQFKVYHNISPQLGELSLLSFQNKLFIKNKDIDKNFYYTLIATREEYLLRTLRFGKRFVETNNRITFFAYEILKLFPNAKFVHLYRNPTEFVRSGLRRGWYSEVDGHYFENIRPIDNEKWKNYSRIEKISWQWYQTNTFIDEFLKNVDSKNFIKINFNMLKDGDLEKLLNFINFQSKNSSKLLDKEVNKQLTGDFPKYEKWDLEDKNRLKKICGNLAKSYGYKI